MLLRYFFSFLLSFEFTTYSTHLSLSHVFFFVYEEKSKLDINLLFLLLFFHLFPSILEKKKVTLLCLT